ncbi:MAG: hypothetical protein R3F62_00765 [Planctomycetota bacterium]
MSLEVPLLRCRAGRHLLVLDLEALVALDGGERRAERLVDLRELVGEHPGPGQGVLFQARDGGLVAMVVDPGVELIRVPLDRLHPLPDPLPLLPEIRSLRGVVEIQGELAYLVDPLSLSSRPLWSEAAAE